MEYVIRLQWDPEAEVWVALNDYIPLALESDSLDQLVNKVKDAVPELLELNDLPKPKFLTFFAERREETGDGSGDRGRFCVSENRRHRTVPCLLTSHRRILSSLLPSRSRTQSSQENPVLTE